MSNEELHRHKKRICLLLAFCAIVGLLILAACRMYDKSVTIHPQDGLELTLKYVGERTKTTVSFYGDDDKLHLFDVTHVTTEYDRKPRTTEYVTVYLSDIGTEATAVIHLLESKDPSKPTPTPPLEPTPIS